MIARASSASCCVVDFAAAVANLALVGLEIKVEMRERVVLDGAGAVAQRVELRQPSRTRRAARDEIARMAERALEARVGQRVVYVVLEFRRGRDVGHRRGSFWLSPIAGPSAMPARTSATWRAMTAEPSR